MKELINKIKCIIKAPLSHVSAGVLWAAAVLAIILLGLILFTGSEDIEEKASELTETIEGKVPAITETIEDHEDEHEGHEEDDHEENLK